MHTLPTKGRDDNLSDNLLTVTNHMLPFMTMRSDINN